MRRAQKSAVLSLLAMACCGEERPKAGLMLALDTDMTVPAMVAEVGLYIEHVDQGRRTLVVSQRAKPLYDEVAKQYVVKFAATFAVESGLEVNSTERIRTRFVAYGRDGAPVAMREARSAVPTDSVRQLRLPLLFVNQGRVIDTQAAVASSSDGSLQLQQTAGSGDDPFTRYRQEGCADEETLGDDGECTSIDVSLDALPQAESLPAIESCLDVTACFGGARGSRSFDLGADCTVQVPPSEAEGVALALHTEAGYEVGGQSAAKVQPVDDQLYTYDPASGRLQLKPSLCKRAQAARIDRVAVSVKCAPKTPTTPICAPWRSEPAMPAAPTTVGYVDDPPLPEADAHADADADEDGGPRLEAFHRELLLPAGAYSQWMTSFASGPEGDTLLMVGGEIAFVGRAGAGKNDVVSPAPIDHALGYTNLAIELGAGGNAYLMPERYSGAAPQVLRPASTALEEVRFGPSCETSLDMAGFFTVGTHLGETVAFYGGPNMQNVSTDRARPNDPACFENVDEVTDAGTPSTMYRGSTLGGAFRIPIENDTKLLDLVPDRDPRGMATAFGPVIDAATQAQVSPQSLVAIDDSHAILLGMGTIGGEGLPSSFFFQVTWNGAAAELGPRIGAPVAGQPSRELYGAQGVVCARIENTDRQFESAYCIRRSETGVHTAFSLQAATPFLSDLHVYGDSDYLYLAKSCWSDAEGRNDRVRITATPWAAVDASTADGVAAGCPDSTPFID